MVHSLSELLQCAAAERWTTDSRKADDEARPLRDALAELVTADAPRFVEDLCEVDPADLYLIEGWAGALFHAFALLEPVQIQLVAERWHERFRADVRIVDWVLFQLVRTGRISPPLSTAWLNSASALALDTRDPSLVESLLYVLGPEFGGRDDLRRLAKRLKYHPPLRHALKRARDGGA